MFLGIALAWTIYSYLPTQVKYNLDPQPNQVSNQKLNQKPNQEPEQKPNNEPSLSLSERIQKPFTGDLDKLRERRIIRVLISHTKTNFFLTSKGFRGLEYDLLTAYESYLNRGPKRQRYETHLSFIPVPFSELLPKLQQGYGDIAASGLTITPEREIMVDFTIPYITNVKEVLVSYLNAPEISKLEELSGKQIIVVANSSYIINLTKANLKLGLLGLAPIEIVKADPLLEAEDLLELVNANLYDYTVVDNHIAAIWAEVLNNIVIHPDLVFNSNSNIAWAIQKDLPKLKASLNGFIQKYAKPGRLLGNTVYKKYFKNPYWIKQPLTHDLLKKVDCLEYYFKKYGEFYEFDWHLLAALAYQESRFKQEKTSHAGAVGIMQIKPSTAKDKNVNINNIHKIENNVHAGVKYLAFLRDRYFSSEKYTIEEQGNFSLAAYNAGPRRILRLQNIAEKRGLDPYRWFYNVEIIAREDIGHETVNYVTSIQKMKLFLKSSHNLDRDRRDFLSNKVQDKKLKKVLTKGDKP